MKIKISWFVLSALTALLFIFLIPMIIIKLPEAYTSANAPKLNTGIDNDEGGGSGGRRNAGNEDGAGIEAKEGNYGERGDNAAKAGSDDAASDDLTIDKQDSDNWRLFSPDECGIDSEILASNVDSALKGNFKAIKSLLIVRHGKLVYEKYNNTAKDSLQDVFSITKSITSALVGIAIEKGLIKSVDQKLTDYFPEYAAGGADPKVKEITLHQMLTMTSGLEAVDNNYPEWTQSDDWFRYAINRKMLGNPGAKFIYNTGISHVMGGVVAKAANVSLKDFAEENLFGPLGITNYYWRRDTSGRYGGGNLLNLTPRDMAKFGYLYLMGGKWNGAQVLPAGWIEETFKPWADPGDGSKYGYYWWIFYREHPAWNKTITVYSASGYGGQYISVIPELDMVAVITCDPFHPESCGSSSFDLIPGCIFPAMK